MDIKVPNDKYDEMEVYFWNSGGQKELIIHDVYIESFDLD